MITEDCVSFEIAKLLKEKGFDGKCSRVWVKEENASPLRISMPLFVEGEEVADRKTVEQVTSYNKYRFETYITGYLCPTLQMAMKWLREVHNLVICAEIGNENYSGNVDYCNPDRWYWFFDITNEKGVVVDTKFDYISNEYSSYEEACEAAIKYCLENLI